MSALCSSRAVDDTISIIEMSRKPVNSLNKEMIEALTAELDTVERSGAKAAVLTSAVPNIFSAGLDITEMWNPEETRLRAFWSSLQEMWLRFYGSSLALSAAIEGASPAGGCLLALTCDYRVMVDDARFTIGLNETALGIVAPPWFAATMSNTVGHRHAERHLQLGTLMPPADAWAIDMVDEVVPAGDVRARAEAAAREFAAIPADARHSSKMRMRGATLDTMRSPEARKADVDDFVSFCMQDSVQAGLTAYMEMLAKRAAAKKKK